MSTRAMIEVSRGATVVRIHPSTLNASARRSGKSKQEILDKLLDEACAVDAEIAKREREAKRSRYGGKYHCSRCGRAGHNVRSCPQPEDYDRFEGAR